MTSAPRALIWRYLRHNGDTLLRVGRNADGTLHNPNGYPEDLVRVAVDLAEQQWRQRRSDAARKAAETRRKRTQARIYEVARRIVAGHIFGPRGNCYICGRELDDSDSIERGIGSECWQRVLDSIKAPDEQAALQPVRNVFTQDNRTS